MSQVGRCLGGADLAAMLEATLPPRAERQTLPCVMAAVRSTWLEHFAAQRRLEDYAAALLWSSWSWIGRPLFASEFGQEIPASYPHLMDLRAVASKEWYYNRTKDIPEKYTADALARSDIEPGDRFHFYITGAGGTGKSCFIRYIYQQLEQQPNVFPIWYRVDTPSSDWKNVEDGIKLEVKRRISESLSRDAAAAALPSDDLELKYYLKELHKRLRDSGLGTEKIFVFIDQLERTFESGDNPEPKRLDDISKAVVALLKEVKADQGIQIFLASRKQYLPDFLSSYENASKNKLHFNVLQTIGDTSEQVGFVDRVLSWCRDDRNLVHESVKFDESAAKLLTTNARGHPLNMMLALIQVFSLDRKGTIGTEWVAENRPWDNQNLFGLDLNLFAKDDIDWFFLLAMAHARTEIVRIEEVWWYLRLVEAKLTKRVDDLGPKGVFERLWLLGHVGRTIYARSIEKGVARFVEFFHANLRDHLIKEVMNQGGLVGSTGRRGGTPPVWRALDRLASAARDWDQSQQLLQADDVRVMMEHRIVLTERLQREEKDEETFFLLFLRDQKEARARLCEAAKQCFAYSAIVHDDFGRWAFENLFPDIEQRTALCRQWLTRCDKDSRMSVLRYLIETESPVTRELLAELVADDGDVHGDAEAWREIAEILTEPRLAARYRTNVVLAVLRHSLQEVAAPPERFPDRVDEFCVASCEGSRDELQVLLRDCTAQLKGRSDRESAVALEVLASDQVTDAWLGRAERTRLSPAARDRSGTGRVAPPKVELLLGTRIGAEIPEDQPRLWQSALAEKLGIAVPPLETARKRDEEEDETKQAYFECGIELKIKGESIAIDNFYPGRSLVFKRHLAHADSVDLSDAEVDYNFGFQEDVYWLPERGIDQPDVRRRALPTLDAIERWLELAMRDHVDKFLDLEQLIEFLKGIADEIDVSQLFHGVSLPALRRILVNLVEESVPLTGRRVELMEELQRLITQGGDTDVISQKLREHVSRDLCERLADDSGRLPILILGERLEADLKNEYLQIDDGFPLLRLPPRLAQHLVATVVRQTNRILEEDDVLPVVACEAPLRFPLARLFKRFDSRIHVISYTELSTEVVPEIRDQITAEQD